MFEALLINRDKMINLLVSVLNQNLTTKNEFRHIIYL